MKATLHFLLLTTMFSVLALSCKSKLYTYDSYKGERITIGSGGGFTGRTTQYVIFENGQLFKKNNEEYIELSKIDKKIVDQQFFIYRNQEFNQLDLNDPGNLSYFIILNESKDKSHKIQWGGGNQEVSEVLEKYYNNLSAIINKNKSINDK